MIIIKNKFPNIFKKIKKIKKIFIYYIFFSIFTVNNTSYALPSCSSVCINGICNRISWFSFPVDHIAYNIDFDALALSKKRCYERSVYLPYIAGDDKQYYKRYNKHYGLWVDAFGENVDQSP